MSRGTILSIAPSEVKEGVMWVGTGRRKHQLTKDAGKSWQHVTPPNVTEWSTVSIVEASHFDAGTAYAAVNRNSHDDLKPHILRTRDFGQTWQETVRGIREMDFVRTVREDPVRKGLLYAGRKWGCTFRLIKVKTGNHCGETCQWWAFTIGNRAG